MRPATFPVRLYIKGRCVATIQPDGDGTVTLTKAGLDPLRHRLNQPPAWALDANHIARLRAASASAGTDARIRLHLCTGESLEISLTDFDRYSFQVSRGHGLQLAVAEYRWAVRGPDGRLGEPMSRAPAPAQPPARRTPAPAQLSLFAREVAQ